MPSATALTLVNRALLLSGDYKQLTSLLESPSNIAERIIQYMNMVVSDIGRLMDMPVLGNRLIAITDGINSFWVVSTLSNAAQDSIVSVTVGNSVLEYVSLSQLRMHQATNDINGQPSVYTSLQTANNSLAIEIFPLPSSGLAITVESYDDPSEFTLTDLSTTELTGINDIIILGVMMHMDLYDELGRGYDIQYSAAKLKLMTHLNRNKEVRITTESYR